MIFLNLKIVKTFNPHSPLYSQGIQVNLPPRGNRKSTLSSRILNISYIILYNLFWYFLSQKEGIMPLGGRLTSVAGGFLSVAFILSGIVFLLVKVKVTPLIIINNYKNIWAFVSKPVKLLYEYDREFLGYSLIFLAAWSIISWIRTFFFMPTELMPKRLMPEYAKVSKIQSIKYYIHIKINTYKLRFVKKPTKDLQRESAMSHLRKSLASRTLASVVAGREFESNIFWYYNQI